MALIKTNGLDKKFYYNDLFYDYLFDFGKVSRFYSYDPSLMESYRERADELAEDFDHSLRSRLAGAVAAHNHRLGCSSETLNNIEKLKKRDSVVLIGGQQPVLFGGPLFIYYKAVTIIGMAKHLEKELGLEVVPCFWNASDDSNTSQIDSISILTNKGLEHTGLGPLKEERFSDILLTQEKADEILGKLGEKLDPSDFKPKIIDFFGDCIKNAFQKRGMAVSDLFSSIMLKFFSGQGLVIIDPAIPGLKDMGWEVIRSDIENFKMFNSLVRKAGQKLEYSGYHSQINVVQDTLNFFFTFQGKRKSITYQNGSFRINSKELPREQLVQDFRKDISSICPNVMLRPLFQDTILPVLATVCGPGEVSYFAQLKEVYKSRGKRLPILYPRFSATLVEKKVKKILEKYRLDYSLLGSDFQKLEKIALKKFLDIDIDRIVSELEHDIMKRITDAEQEVCSDHMEAASSFDRIRRNLAKETGVLKSKLFSEYQKQNRHLKQGIDKVGLNLLPQGQLQERKISILSYIDKYDFKFVDMLEGCFVPFDYRHKFLEVVY